MGGSCCGGGDRVVAGDGMGISEVGGSGGGMGAKPGGGWMNPGGGDVSVGRSDC